MVVPLKRKECHSGACGMPGSVESMFGSICFLVLEGNLCQYLYKCKDSGVMSERKVSLP